MQHTNFHMWLMNLLTCIYIIYIYIPNGDYLLNQIHKCIWLSKRKESALCLPGSGAKKLVA